VMRSRTGEGGEFASFASGSFEEGEDDEGEEVQVVSKSYLVYDDNLETRALSKGWNRHLRDHPHETAGNKYAFAIKMYTKIIDNNPHSSDALLSRSWAYYMRGMYMDAFDDAAEALEYAQTNVTCYLRAGAALEAIGQVEDAYGVFQEALEIDQKDVRLKKAMSEVLPLVLRERGSAAVTEKDFVKAAKLFAEGGQLKGQLRPWFLVSESRAHSMAGSANLARHEKPYAPSPKPQTLNSKPSTPGRKF
jgi:tetratricopeptide (TPR) repeat protein